MPDNTNRDTNDASPKNIQKVIDYNGLSTYHAEILKLFQQYKQESNVPEVYMADSYLDFPAVGNENYLYIDKTENKTYRYSPSLLHYVVIGGDYHDIKVINGNFSQ